jgi:hypothetical protein
MKRIIAGFFLVLFLAGAVYASGDKNHGTTGSGTTSTGSSAHGTASQPRTGR